MNGPDLNGSKTIAKILVVEDEEMLRMMVETILQGCGYDVRTAGSADEAIELWRRHEADFDLLLTDMMLPDGISGRQVARQLQTERPDLKVIYASGFSTDTIGDMDEELNDTNFLQKPYTTQALAQTVERSLAQAQAA